MLCDPTARAVVARTAVPPETVTGAPRSLVVPDLVSRNWTLPCAPAGSTVAVSVTVAPSTAVATGDAATDTVVACTPAGSVDWYAVAVVNQTDDVNRPTVTPPWSQASVRS